MGISRRTLAKEWLIFLALLPFGALACYLLGYYWPFHDVFGAFSALDLGYRRYNRVSSPFDEFWNDAFGLAHFQTLLLWLIPYLAVAILRSIWYSIKTLRN